MALFWKAVGAVLIATVLGITVGKQEKDLAILLTIAVCILVGGTAISYLEPLLDFLRDLKQGAGLPHDLLKILLQAAGIGIACEWIAMICTDAGNGSLAKAVQMLSTCAIGYLSIPVFQMFLTLIRDILGDL